MGLARPLELGAKGLKYGAQPPPDLTAIMGTRWTALGFRRGLRFNNKYGAVDVRGRHREGRGPPARATRRAAEVLFVRLKAASLASRGGG
jgi:hypothetical protein